MFNIATMNEKTLGRGLYLIEWCKKLRDSWQWFNGLVCTFTIIGCPKTLISASFLMGWMSFWSYFILIFRSLRCHVHVTKLTLEVNVNLACFRDPLWCILVPLTERTWLCVQHCCGDTAKPIQGTPFANIFFKLRNKIQSVFTQFMLHNPVSNTLVLLAC